MTEETTENNIININGTEYDANDFSGEQKYVIQQLRDLSTKADNLRFQLDQIQAAQKIFTDTLIQSVENPKTEETPEAEVVN